MEIDVIDLTRPADRPSGRQPWRTPLAIGLAVAFIIACTGMTLVYRHARANEWVDGTAAWQEFDVSRDGRTLTFHTYDVGHCTRITGVDFSTDPTAGGALTATLQTRTQTKRDGHPVFCTLALSIDGSTHPVTFDRPVPNGTIITDGAMLPLARSCDRAEQVVRAPTNVAPVGPGPYGCTAAG